MSYGVFLARPAEQPRLLSDHDSIDDAVRLICAGGLTGVKLGRNVSGDYRPLSDIEVKQKAAAYARHRRETA